MYDRTALFFCALVFFVGCDDAPPGDADIADAGADASEADADDDTEEDANGFDADADADEELVEPEWPAIAPGSPFAGVATATLDLPVGTPLAAYTSRCWFFGGEPVDERDAPYTTTFGPSVGVQTRIPVAAIWLEAGDQRVVFLKVGLGYAFDGLVHGVERTIAEQTGEDLAGRVLLITDHSHASYGAFSQAHFLWLGGDRYHGEIFDRTVRRAADVALEARERLQPVAVGFGIDPDFDPDGEIAHLRRSEAYGLVDAFGEEVGPGYKDQNLYLLRIDSTEGTGDPADDRPLALLFGFGMHGTVLGGDNQLVSSEAMGAVELALEERFDHPVAVVAFQVNTGDQSPSGRDHGFARMESIGELAAPRVMELFDAVETSADPIRLEGATRTVHQGYDIRVRRGGEVDWYYPPYDEDGEADLEIFDADGVPLNPFDEFRAPYGAALCGEDEAQIPFVDIGVEVMPYTSCILIDVAGDLLFPGLFQTVSLYPFEYPLWETRSTMVGALALDAIPVTTAGQGTRRDRVLFGLFPGEVTTLLGRELQHRAGVEGGLGTVVPVAFGLDHEGYLMTVEDWLRGGYESSINTWGPLQGEHVLERVLEMVELVATPEAEDPSWPRYRDQDYPAWPLDDVVVPAPSRTCGAPADHVPDTLWTRDGWRPESPQPPAEVRRVSGIAHFLFLGGDPAIDLPEVVLQREGEPGGWEDVLLPSGRRLTDRGVEMILSHTPDPLTAEPGAARDFYWLVELQAVATAPSAGWVAGLPEGRYRFTARGRCADPAETAPPFVGRAYEVSSEPFAVTGRGAIVVRESARDAASLTLEVEYPAAPRGFRHLHPRSDSDTPTPIVGGDGEPAVTVELFAPGDPGDPLRTWTDVAAVEAGDRSLVTLDLAEPPPAGAVVRVLDLFGNSGETTLAP